MTFFLLSSLFSLLPGAHESLRRPALLRAHSVEVAGREAPREGSVEAAPPLLICDLVWGKELLLPLRCVHGSSCSVHCVGE